MDGYWREDSVANEGGDRDSDGGPGGAALRVAQDTTGNSHAEEGMAKVEGDALPACVANYEMGGRAPTSVIHSNNIARSNLRWVAGIRRLFVLAFNVVRAVLPSQCASHDLKGIQRAKSKGRATAVLDFGAEHGL